MSLLPPLTADAEKHSQQLTLLIRKSIEESGGWMDFSQFMHMALYTPQLGYYSGGCQKFGEGGDFVTATELSPLFAQTVARQMAQVLQVTQGDILELGAGTGKLAAETLLALAQWDTLPRQYYILEVSDYLRQVQRETLQQKLPDHLIKRVEWLDVLPTEFTGVIFGNELLDALPVHLISMGAQGLCVRGVSVREEDFVWQDRPLTQGVLYDMGQALHLPAGYLTEVCPQASGLVTSLAQRLRQGVILLLDYGFPAQEYYHPQRNSGTLMCHYRHHAHTNPLLYVGVQDITAHVDFTRISNEGMTHGLQLSGFCSQAQFLINCGILDILAQTSPHDVVHYVPLVAAAQKLLSPAEMGDLFKVIALSKGMDDVLIGFVQGDKSHTL